MTDTVVDTPAQGDYLSMSDAEIMVAGAPAEVMQEPAAVEEETLVSGAVAESNTGALEGSATDDRGTSSRRRPLLQSEQEKAVS